MTLLSDGDIAVSLASSDWRRDPPSRGAGGEAIVREWRFEDFGRAIAFVNRVADVAESVGHHPDIHVHDWNRVRLTLSTHSTGGLTQADFDMAARIDKLA